MSEDVTFSVTELGEEEAAIAKALAASLLEEALIDTQQKQEESTAARVLEDVGDPVEENGSAGGLCLALSGFYDFKRFSYVEHLQPLEILERIKAHKQKLVEMEASGVAYKLPMTLRSDKNSLFFKDQIRLGKKTKHTAYKRSPKKYARIWAVMNFLSELLQAQQKVTQRELFYCMADSFENQRQLNDTIQEVVALLNVPRSSLGITTTPRGSIVGCVRLKIDGKWIDCTRVGAMGTFIPGDLELIQEVDTNARFVVVVEKDSVFQRLAEDKIYNIVPCALITAKGIPDLATRALLRRLQQANIPLLGLVDWDVGGFRVLQTYKYGSVNMGLESFHYTVDMKLLGLSIADIETLSFPEWCKLPLTNVDIRAIDLLLSAEVLTVYKEELQAMKDKGFKLEIEALNSFGLSFLCEYVVKKMIQRRYY
ncbi:meiotic recombination protein SPO11-2 [Balamuthia mandrillaris]